MSRPQLIYARLLPSFFCLLVWSGCSLHQPPQERHVSDLGYFQFRAPTEAMKGVIIGAPHGSAEPASDEYAKWISDQTGAGFIVAYGFGVKRLAVTRPLIGSIANSRIPNDPRSRGNIYREFRRMLRQTAGGNLVSLYVGVRSAARESELNQIEIASSGFTFDELNHLKRSFLRIRDRLVMDSEIPKISVAIDPLDKISWPVYAMKHHGVLMSAQRGLNLRLPQILSATPAKLIYRRVLSVWISEALDLIHKNRQKEASVIKRRYREIRDRLLADAPDVESVDLLIEPLDDIEIGAWAAKAHGILSVVKKSLHVELPLYGTLRSSKARERYTEILAAVLVHSVPDLLSPNHSTCKNRNALSKLKEYSNESRTRQRPCR